MAKSFGLLKRGPIVLVKNTEHNCAKLKYLSKLVVVKHVTIRNYANPYGTSRLNDRGELFLGDTKNLNQALEGLASKEHVKQENGIQ